MDLDLSGAQHLLAEAGARPPAPQDPLIDGLQPALVFEPEGAEAAGRALALCHREGLAVVPVGAGSRLHLGNFPSRLDAYLSTSRLRGIFDYEPGDLTVSAAAGTPLGEIQTVAAREGQFLPWDPPLARRATVGGILAAGDPGFRRRPGARPRDLLLGFEALLADGTAVKAGGRVVKNVAGYELMKLMVGSLGTLAVLTGAHLRLRPRPETGLTLAASFPDLGQAQLVISELRRRALDPEVLAVVNPGLAASFSLAGWSLLLRFEGLEEEVRAGAATARELIRPVLADEIADPDDEKIWSDLRDFPSVSVHPAPDFVVRGQALPAQALALAERWEGAGLMVVYPDGGLLYARSDEPEDYFRLASAAQEMNANAVLEAGPVELKRDVDVFGETPGGFELMKKIKEKLDPKAILSPGRFAGRL